MDSENQMIKASCHLDAATKQPQDSHQHPQLYSLHTHTHTQYYTYTLLSRDDGHQDSVMIRVVRAKAQCRLAKEETGHQGSVQQLLINPLFVGLSDWTILFNAYSECFERLIMCVNKCSLVRDNQLCCIIGHQDSGDRLE